MRLSAGHIIVLVLLVLLLFGANRLPDLARSVGQSLKIFKREVQELREDDADGDGRPGGAPGTGAGTTAGGDVDGRARPSGKDDGGAGGS